MLNINSRNVGEVKGEFLGVIPFKPSASSSLLGKPHLECNPFLLGMAQITIGPPPTLPTFGQTKIASWRRVPINYQIGIFHLVMVIAIK